MYSDWLMISCWLTIRKVSTGQYQHKTFRFITMMRGGLISMLYSKATDVALTDVDTASSMTLMSADIERIVTGMETGHEVCTARSLSKEVQISFAGFIQAVHYIGKWHFWNSTRSNIKQEMLLFAVDLCLFCTDVCYPRFGRTRLRLLWRCTFSNDS
jgi:hypothetical protein